MTQRINVLELTKLERDIRACTRCTDLPLGPRPIFQIHSQAKILIAGQAPGRKTHHKNIPFDDPSGNKLRDWLGVSRDEFYDETKIAILPMAFCYPGTGKSGDLPPPSQCARQWRNPLLNQLHERRLTLVIGQYALDWHLGDLQHKNLTETVKHWQHYWPETLPMPHPSPRNNRWLKNNPWFETDVLPALKIAVRQLI